MLLVIVAIGPLGAAFFAPDAITTPRHSATPAGRSHSLFGACFVVGFPIAATVIGWDLVGNQLVAPIQHYLSSMSLVVWLGFITFMGSLYFFGRITPQPGPHLLIGWSNRFMVLTYLAWLIILASAIVGSRAGRPSSSQLLRDKYRWERSALGPTSDVRSGHYWGAGRARAFARPSERQPLASRPAFGANRPRPLQGDRRHNDRGIVPRAFEAPRRKSAETIATRR